MCEDYFNTIFKRPLSPRIFIPDIEFPQRVLNLILNELKLMLYRVAPEGSALSVVNLTFELILFRIITFSMFGYIKIFLGYVTLTSLPLFYWVFVSTFINSANL